jgi:hypothetical protein
VTQHLIGRRAALVALATLAVLAAGVALAVVRGATAAPHRGVAAASTRNGSRSAAGSGPGARRPSAARHGRSPGRTAGHRAARTGTAGTHAAHDHRGSGKSPASSQRGSARTPARPDQTNLAAFVGSWSGNGFTVVIRAGGTGSAEFVTQSRASGHAAFRVLFVQGRTALAEVTATSDPTLWPKVDLGLALTKGELLLSGKGVAHRV